MPILNSFLFFLSTQTLARLSVFLISPSIPDTWLNLAALGFTFDLIVALTLALLLGFISNRIILFILYSIFSLTQLGHVLFYAYFHYPFDQNFWSYASSPSGILMLWPIFTGLISTRIALLNLLVPLLFALFFVRKTLPQTNRRVNLVLLVIALLLNWGVNRVQGNLIHHRSGLALNPFIQNINQYIEYRAALKNTRSRSFDRETVSRFWNIQSPLTHSVYTDAHYPLFRIPEKGCIVPQKKKNLVFIFLESFGALSISGLSPIYRHTTPNLERLSKEGLSFTHMYYNMNPTSPAEMASLCSVYPEDLSPHVRTEMSCIGSLLLKHGYQTESITGHIASYDNQESFFVNHGIRSVLGELSFPFPTPLQPAPEGHWGRFTDRDIFEASFGEIEKFSKQGDPFFLSILTNSTHAPFPDFGPEFQSDEGFGDRKNLHSSMRFTDKYLGEFIDRSKKQEWYKNTMFFIFADHTPNTREKWPVDQDFSSPLVNSWINLLILGAGEQHPPRTLDTVASHVDLVPTALGLLGFSLPNAFVGSDLLDQTIPAKNRFAYSIDRALHETQIITPEFAFTENQISKEQRLFKLPQDPWARNNIAQHYPEKLKELSAHMNTLEKIKTQAFETNHLWKPEFSERCQTTEMPDRTREVR